MNNLFKYEVTMTNEEFETLERKFNSSPFELIFSDLLVHNWK